MRTALPGVKHCNSVWRNVWCKVVFSARGHRITHFRCDFLRSGGCLILARWNCKFVNTDTFCGPFRVRINPSNPKIKIAFSFVASIHFHQSSGEKLIKYLANSSCVIMSLILITTLFYKVIRLQGEIWCWSLLGLKGLTGFGCTCFFLVDEPR